MLRKTLAPQVVLLCGLGFGDEGKGTTVDFLTDRLGAHTVVRYNGGPQAAHTVVEKDRHHVFAQFGSGTLLGAQTYLSSHMLVCPFRLQSEAAALDAIGIRRPLDMVAIDRAAPLVTPVHKLACQVRELARQDRHGSCGVGIWETTRIARQIPKIAPRVGDLEDIDLLMEKIEALRLEMLYDVCDDVVAAKGTPRYAAASRVYQELDDLDLPALRQRYAEVGKESALGKHTLVDSGYLGDRLQSGTTIFEGAQGVLLDETWGFHPHTTGSTTTFANAEDILSDLGYGEAKHRIGVLRSYMTRHGQGPMPTELRTLASEEVHNKTTPWAGDFRHGLLDLVLLRYALGVVGGVDSLSLTHADRWSKYGAACVSYSSASQRYFQLGGALLRRSECPDLGYQEGLGRAVAVAQPVCKSGDLIEIVEDQLQVDVSVLSSGSGRGDKRWLNKRAGLPVAAACG